MPKRRSGQKYAGVLSEPIYEPIISGVGLLNDSSADDLKDAAIKRALKRCFAKFPALCKHYNLDPADRDRWIWLSFYLARDHVPGFRVYYKEPPKAGRKKKWDVELDEELLRVVENTRAGKTIKEAITKLAKDHPTFKTFASVSLQVRYREAKTARNRRKQLEEELARISPFRLAPLDLTSPKNDD
jgi:hypothetical protein